MLIHVADVLSAEQVAQARQQLNDTDWADGKITAGHQSGQVKRNLQLPQQHPVALSLGELITTQLERHPTFISAALPARLYPPLFNRYDEGMDFGHHVDNAIRLDPLTGRYVRTDLSATLFLSDPTEYEGGELVMDQADGPKAIKLPAGDLILYPATTVHHIRPITRGQRIAAFFWVQSMVRDQGQRELLFNLDISVQQLNQSPDGAVAAAAVRLTGTYHNLLRMWAEV
jgi:PKHD-type hydroxylase